MNEDKLSIITKKELYTYLRQNEKTQVERFTKKPRFLNSDFKYVRAKALVFQGEWLNDRNLYDKITNWIADYVGL